MKSKIPKRLLSSLLSVALLTSICTPTMIFADDLDTDTVTEDTSSLSSQSTYATLTAEALMFNITVPTTIPIDVSSTGKVSVGDDFTITNNSVGPIEVTDFSVTSLNGWTIKDYDTNFSQEKVDTQAYGIKFFDDEVSEGGGAIALASSDWTIIYGKDELSDNDELTIDYSANVAAQSESISATNIGLVQITLDWSSDKTPTISGVSNGQTYNIVYGEAFEAPTVTATDYEGDALDVAVVGLSDVDTFTAGTYEITYTATDEDNGTSKSVTIYVVVASSEAPVIYGVTDGQSFSLNYGDSYTEPTVTATNYDGTETIDVVVTGDTISSSPESGSYSVTYAATDTTLGLSTSVTIKIVVYGEVVDNISYFYTYTYDSTTSGYKVAMTNDFKTAVNSTDAEFIVDDEVLWETGDVLPNPGSTYDGTSGELPVTNMSHMFYNCQSIESLDLSGWDTSNAKRIDQMFSDCLNVIFIDGISNWDTSSVTNMYGVFGTTGSSYIMSIKTLDLSNWDVGNVTDMAYMFYNCSNLETLGDLSNWNTSNVISIYDIFANCSSLTTLGDLSGWDMSNVTSMWEMFYKCTNLKTLGDLSNWNVGNVQSMQSAFYFCYQLTTLGDISDWDTNQVVDMSYMFRSCYNLISLDLSNWNTGNVKTMYAMFAGCSGLTSLNIANWNTEQNQNMSTMFQSCSFTTLDISKWNTENVTTMEKLFYGCDNLEYIDVSYFKTGNVKSMKYLFSNCSSLETINGLSNWDTSNVTSTNQMFYLCSSLTDISELSVWNVDSITDCSSMFGSCSKLSGEIYVGLDSDGEYYLYYTSTYAYGSKIEK